MLLESSPVLNAIHPIHEQNKGSIINVGVGRKFSVPYLQKRVEHTIQILYNKSTPSLKNKFLDVMHTKNDPAAARKNLSDWFMEAEPSDLQEFKSCITAYRNWSEEILNSLDVRYSNGFTEGCNNKTKVLKRVCFGFRNFDNFRSRILHCST